MWQRISLSVAVVSLINLALGLFLFVSPWLFGFPSGFERNTSWMAGATIAIVAVYSITDLFESAPGSEWFEQEEWINLAVGFWLMVCPWLLGFHGDTVAKPVHFAVGLVIAVIAAIELWLLRHTPREQTQLDRN